MCFSYCGYNYKNIEGFQRYSKHVPSYLINQSRDLVLTCLNRFEGARNVDKTGVVQVGSGDFSVISGTENATSYRVSFGTDKKCLIAHVLPAAEDHISHQNENIEKEGNHSDEAMQREEEQRVVKKNVKIVWRICHQQRLGAYHYHHSLVVCCTI